MVATAKRLRVRIGPHREALEIAHVNAQPTEIDTEYFVGRVLVRVRDFNGSPNAQDAAYFAGRSRKFSIQIEGRFKALPGQEPYTGDEIEFGTDFVRLVLRRSADRSQDRLIEFPRALFNAGLRVAKLVDSSVHYELSSKPYIMSPYAACSASATSPCRR